MRDADGGRSLSGDTGPTSAPAPLQEEDQARFNGLRFCCGAGELRM